MAADTLMGGTIGAVLGPLTEFGGSAVTGAVKGLISGGVREAVDMGSAAAATSLRSLGDGQVGGLVGKALAGRSATSAGRGAVEDAGVTVSSRVKAQPGNSCPNSFAACTAVLMADGSTKKIEDVRLGDTVVASDPSTGETGAEPVTALITGIGVKQMVTLTVDAGGAKGHQTATITATDGHPFWVPELGTWKTAGELKPGAMLQTGPGTYAIVTATKAWTAPHEQVHNLTINHLHTYYVLAGTTPVLAHNCGTFDNQMPGALAGELAAAERLGVTLARPGSASFDAAVSGGTVKWAVLEDGSLVVQPKFVGGHEISHAVLSRGAPVRAAGEADIAGSSSSGFLDWILTITAGISGRLQKACNWSRCVRAGGDWILVINLDELTELNLSDLAKLLVDRASSWAGMRPSEWRSVLELFTSRLASSDRQMVAQDLSLLRSAHEILIAAARSDGAVDERESILRQVNILVALAGSSTADPEVDNLATTSKRMVLENLPLSLELARTRAPSWRALSTDEIREMRYAKNLLSPLKSIAERGLNPDDSARVDAWLELLPSLP